MQDEEIDPYQVIMLQPVGASVQKSGFISYLMRSIFTMKDGETICTPTSLEKIREVAAQFPDRSREADFPHETRLAAFYRTLQRREREEGFKIVYDEPYELLTDDKLVPTEMGLLETGRSPSDRGPSKIYGPRGAVREEIRRRITGSTSKAMREPEPE